ncbi:MAG TPA: porin [Tepidisphaeraceae bacterium]|jgi:hypothetical protein
MGRSIQFVGAAIAAAMLSGGIGALGADPTPAELKAQIEQLQVKVQQLEQKQQTVNSRDVDETVARIMSDTNRRSQFLADDVALTAGYDNGFFIGSADKNFLLRPGFIFQTRNVSNFRQNAKQGGSSDDFQNGFEITRAKLFFDGNIFSPDLSYRFQWASDRNSGATLLEDAWAQYRLRPGFAIRAGQFKTPVHHEELTGDQMQLAAERSLVNALLGGGAVGPRSQGVDFLFGTPTDPLHYEVMLHDGDGSVNTDFRDDITPATAGTPPVAVRDTRPNWGAAGRAEWKLMGDWNDYKDFSARNDTKDLLVVGGALDMTQFDGSNVYRGTADVQYENPRGLGVYGALLADYQDLRNTSAGADDSLFDYGGLIQVGYLLRPNVEVFGRYDVTFLDTPVAGEDQFHELTLGVNYFLGEDGKWGHHAKVTVDLTYLPNGAPSNQTSLGELANPGQSEWVARLQFQLWL